MRKVFLSSTFQDLAEYRKVAFEAIAGLDGYYCVSMETFGARAWTAAEFCQAKVRECHLFVGVLGHLYGSAPTGDERSYTECEYDTAVASGIPRLMFVAPDALSPPMSLREPDDKWRRQVAFRGRVGEEQIRATFTTPKELALEVVKAIRNWEQEQPDDGGAAPPPWPAARRDAVQHSGPNLGSLVSRLCDRTRQEEEFSEFFSLHVKRRPGFPQLYFVRGEESELPNNFIERLARLGIQDYANFRWGEQKAAVADKSVGWPSEGALAQRRQRLLSSLFKQFDPNYGFQHDDFSATAFARLPALALSNVILLRHEVRAERWDSSTKELLGWYCQFWHAVGAAAPAPQFLVFFNVIYPPGGAGSLWRSWLGLSGFDRRRLERDLGEVCPPRDGARGQEEARPDACPSLLLEELSCVKREHVMEWFQQHKIYDEWAVWRAKCDVIFRDDDCRPMADIEHELRLIQREFVGKRGYL